MARKILCLDWDKHALRIVAARGGRRRLHLEDAHSHRIPAEVAADDPERMGRFIAQMLALHRIRTRQVVLDVPRDKAVITTLKLPPTPANELTAAVHFVAGRELSYPVDQAAVDYVVSERNEDGLAVEVLLAAVRQDVLNNLLETCRVAGLSPTNVGLRPYANGISVANLANTIQQQVLLIDVGPAVTEIDVVRGAHLTADQGAGTLGSGLVFSRSASVGVPFHGGELVSEDSRISSKAELSQMELIDEAHREVLDELVLEVKRTLQAFRATVGDPHIDQVLVAGGTGIEHALVDAIDRDLSLPADLFDPTARLGVNEHEAPQLRSFSACLGRAWTLAHPDLLELDFLHPKQPVEKHADLKRNLRIAGVAAAMVIVAAGAWVYNDFRQLRGERSELVEINKQLRADLVNYYELENLIQGKRTWEEASRMGIAIEHLLRLTEWAGDLNEPPPGGDQYKDYQKLLVTDFSFRESTGTVTLKLLCNDQETAQAFARRIAEYQIEDRQPYEVERLGSWQPATGSILDPKFKGQTDLTIKLVDLVAHNAGQKERDKAADKRIKELKRAGI